MRARIFFNGLYVTTLMDAKSASDALDKVRHVRPVHHDDEVVVYIDDTYFLLNEDQDGWLQPASDDPRVQGLYGAAVVAERAAAQVGA